ncbi:hypothetical protein N7519_001452 [Penicillium mononematosum]|uniref:uncharacterized protein n=1 Tax=Penicillium mononematosum TaxID=268346 RepID=UPI00254916F4|nr:uncharacterized protein N7519_001452 [Penicillium mononematosum]KAJ6191431.1 hypothetical protein N7519_001452 [Penicillium mononematosum]
MFALGEGDILLLRKLLSVDRIVDHINSQVYMRHAIESGNIEQVKILLTANTTIPDLLQNPEGKPFLETALYIAGEAGNMELVDLLLKAGANVNQTPASRQGATALQSAAIQGYIGISHKLLDAGANVQAPRAERYGRTALEGAAEHGRLDMLQLLLNEGVLIEGDGRIEYIRAIKLAQQDCHYAVATFLESSSDWTDIDSACYEEQLFDFEEARKLDSAPREHMIDYEEDDMLDGTKEKPLSQSVFQPRWLTRHEWSQHRSVRGSSNNNRGAFDALMFGIYMTFYRMVLV